MNAPCSARKDKSGIFSKIKAVTFSDKITVITCAIMFSLMCIGLMLLSCITKGESGGLRHIVGKYNEWNSKFLLIISGECAVFSFALGILTMQYLSKRESAEYYNKLPVGIRKALLIKIVSNMLISICTIVISLAIVYLLSIVLPSYLTPWGNLRATIELFKTLIPYLFMYYGLGVLIGTLCGGIYTKVLCLVSIVLSIGAVIAVYEKYVYSVIVFDGSEFYQLVPYSVLMISGNFNHALEIFGGTYVPADNVIVLMICIGVALMALSVYLVKYRRTEYAEYAFNSTIAARVFRAIGVFATYCIAILKLEDMMLVECGDKPYTSDCIIGPPERNLQNVIGFNYMSAVILFGIFLILSYPLKNRKKYICAYDYLPILFLLGVFENAVFKYWT